MYTVKNFQTKKALKEAVAAGEKIRIYQHNDIFDNIKAGRNYTGTATVEGPHYPKPHTWYATVTLVDGIITKVK